jgi:hypothetical protein
MTAPRSIPSHSAPDRRGSNRFPFREHVRYRALSAKSSGLEGLGRTIDMSSSGVRFTTEAELSRGGLVECAVNWPARLDGACPLQLVAVGRVVRSDAASAVVRIAKYEFRTRKPRAEPKAAGATGG